MSEDIQDSKGGKQRLRGIPLDHTLVDASRPKRQRRPVKDFDEAEEDVNVLWSIPEKEKLVDALCRHSHFAYESISNVVKTKTPKQVEQLIDKVMNSSCLNYEKRVVELDPEKGAAPLELWLSLVQELVMSDKKIDHSKHYTKIMNVIGKNESAVPEGSGFEGLDWTKLYQYVSDLLADKGVLQPLSSMESLVVLDMMHSMGDTLHMSDTRHQRRLLDLKYQLFKRSALTNRNNEYTSANKAVRNNFSDVGFEVLNPDEPSTSSMETIGEGVAIVIPPPLAATVASTSAASSSSSSSSQPQPSTSSKIQPSFLSSTTTATFHSVFNTEINQPASLETIGFATASATTQQNSVKSISSLPTSIPPVLDHDCATTAATARISGVRENTSSPLAPPSLSSSSSSSQQLPPVPPPYNNTTTASVKISQPNTNTTTTQSQPHNYSTPSSSSVSASLSSRLNKHGNTNNTNIKNENSVNNAADKEDENWAESRGDPLPKLFSLNPLTIPPHLLDIRSKSVPTESEIPIVLTK